MAPTRQTSVVSRATPTCGTPKVKKRYKPDRAAKKPQEEWERYREVLRVLWCKHRYSVKDICIIAEKGYREDWSHRQLQRQMNEVWGWKIYRQAHGDEDVSATSTEPVTGASGDGPPAANEVHEEVLSTYSVTRHAADTRCLYSSNPTKISADISLAVRVYERAFEIYASLCEEALQTVCAQAIPMDLLLISCLRAARTPEHETQTLGLFDRYQKLPRARGEAGLSLQISLLRACIEDFPEQPSTIMQEEISGHIIRLLDQAPWYSLSCPFTAVDVGTWLAISQVLWHLPKTGAKTRNYDCEFLKRQPVNSWVTHYRENDDSKPTAFLDCFKWVIRKLTPVPNEPRVLLKVPSFLKDISSDGADLQTINHLILFLSLLESVTRGREPDWWHQSEPQTGITSVGLLSTVCHNILAEPPFQQELQQGPSPSLQSELVRDEDGTVYLTTSSSVATAARACNNLAYCRKWESFLTTLSNEDEMESLREPILSQVRDYLNRAHSLPDPDQEVRQWRDEVSRFSGPLESFGGEYEYLQGLMSEADYSYLDPADFGLLDAPTGNQYPRVAESDAEQ